MQFWCRFWAGFPYLNPIWTTLCVLKSVLLGLWRFPYITHLEPAVEPLWPSFSSRETGLDGPKGVGGHWKSAPLVFCKKRQHTTSWYRKTLALKVHWVGCLMNLETSLTSLYAGMLENYQLDTWKWGAPTLLKRKCQTWAPRHHVFPLISLWMYFTSLFQIQLIFSWIKPCI